MEPVTEELVGAYAKTWATFIVVMVAASQFGKLFPRIGLPLITGFLVVGAACGPYALGIVMPSDLPRLSIISQAALSYIAYSAGAELYLPELRSLLKSIVFQTVGITISCLAICTMGMYVLATTGAITFMADLSTSCSIAASTVAAIIMVTSSPAAAIAVVKELRAKGTFTSTLLGICVLADVFVLLGFSLTTTFAEEECKGEGFDGISLGIMIGVLFGSLLIGYFMGFFLICLISSRRLPTRHVILPLGLAVFIFCHWFTDYTHHHLRYVINLEPLLMCIAAGYVCTNKSKHRHRFINVLQAAGPWVFLPFFTLTGASLDLKVLLASLAIALIVVLIRTAALFIGSAAGGCLAKQSGPHNAHMFLTQITQAGVSLGLASEVGMAFPGWGRQFQTLIISIVIINQVLGPFFFKIGVRRVGEANQASGEGEFDPDAVIPSAIVVGYSPSNVALSAKLLKNNWNVTLVAGTEAEAAAAQEAISAYSKAHHDEQRRKAKSAMNKMVDATVKKPLGKLKATIKQMEDRAVALGNEAVAQAEAERKKAQEGTDEAGAAKDEEHGHGHEHGHEHQRILESGFKVVALVAGSSQKLDWDDVDALLPTENAPASPVAPADGAAAAGPAASADTAQSAAAPVTRDWRFARLVPMIIGPEGATLQAFVASLPTDAATYAAIELAAATIARAPRRSHLHSVRLVAEIQTPAWVQPLTALGAVVVNKELASVQVLASLTSVKLGKPAAVAPPAANNDDVAKASSEAFEGPHFWSFLEEMVEANNSSSGSGAGVGGAASGGLVLRTSSGRVSRSRSRGVSAHSHNSDAAAAATGINEAATGADAHIPVSPLTMRTASRKLSEDGSAGTPSTLQHARSFRTSSTGELPRTLSRVIPSAVVDSAIASASATAGGSPSAPGSTNASRGVAAAAARALRLDAAITAIAPDFAFAMSGGEQVAPWQRDEYVDRLAAMHSSTMSGDLSLFSGRLQANDNLGGFGVSSQRLETVDERTEETSLVERNAATERAKMTADRLVKAGLAAAEISETQQQAARELQSADGFYGEESDGDLGAGGGGEAVGPWEQEGSDMHHGHTNSGTSADSVHVSVRR
jgi:Kef-type K+ transport system membrane component KefB